MKAEQVLGGVILAGGLIYLSVAFKLAPLPKIPPFLPSLPSLYPSQAERSSYIDPPASETASTQPPPVLLGDACPNISTPEEYNAYAKKLKLPLFEGEMPLNSPDDPMVQQFNSLVSGLKTMLGCYGLEQQKDTSTSLPSNYAEQSASYK